MEETSIDFEKIPTQEKVIEEEEQTESVKSIKFSLNTIDSGEAGTITDKITGYLEALIIESSGPVQIEIMIEGINLPIFQAVNFWGVKYLPIRICPMVNSEEKFNYGQERWCLNDSLNIKIMGKPNTLVNVELRVVNY